MDVIDAADVVARIRCKLKLPLRNSEEFRNRYNSYGKAIATWIIVPDHPAFLRGAFS
jgi:hypothetical protein